jgi:hypothetical protein
MCAAALPSGKEPPVLNRSLGGLQNRCGQRGEEKILAPRARVDEVFWVLPQNVVVYNDITPQT